VGAALEADADAVDALLQAFRKLLDLLLSFPDYSPEHPSAPAMATVAMESRSGWDVDGVEIRVILDFGAGFIDHRGWFQNPGA